MIYRAKKTLPSRPGWFGKLREQKREAVRDSPSRCLGEAKINPVWSQPALSVTSDTAGILVPSRKGGVFTKLHNFLTLVFKDKSVKGSSYRQRVHFVTLKGSRYLCKNEGGASSVLSSFPFLPSSFPSFIPFFLYVVLTWKKSVLIASSSLPSSECFLDFSVCQVSHWLAFNSQPQRLGSGQLITCNQMTLRREAPPPTGRKGVERNSNLTMRQVV